MNRLQNLTKQKGFTIVELLIVIVVIGILAAITLVAFNGVQDRSKTAAGQSAANSVVKKAQAYNTINSEYPADETAFNSTEESNLEGINLVEMPDPEPTSGPNDPATVYYELCGSGTGAVVSYWDFTESTGNLQNQTLGTC